MHPSFSLNHQALVICLPHHHDFIEIGTLIIFQCPNVFTHRFMDLTEENATAKNINIYEQEIEPGRNDRKGKNIDKRWDNNKFRHRVDIWWRIE